MVLPDAYFRGTVLESKKLRSLHDLGISDSFTSCSVAESTNAMRDHDGYGGLCITVTLVDDDAVSEES